MAKARGKDTWRLKEPYEILAPSMFGSTKIGETLAAEPEQVENRILETSLSDLTGDFSKSHVKLRFKVNRVEDGKASTEFIGHDTSREYVRSQIRRRAAKIDHMTDATSNDGRKLRIKTTIITLRRIQSSQIKTLRTITEGIIKKRGQKLKFDQFVQELVLEKLASDIYKQIRKICPIRRVENLKSKVLK